MPFRVYLKRTQQTKSKKKGRACSTGTLRDVLSRRAAMLPAPKRASPHFVPNSTRYTLMLSPSLHYVWRYDNIMMSQDVPTCLFGHHIVKARYESRCIAQGVGVSFESTSIAGLHDQKHSCPSDEPGQCQECSVVRSAVFQDLWRTSSEQGKK